LKRKLASIVEGVPACKKKRLYSKAKINGQAIFLRTGEYSDGTLEKFLLTWQRRSHYAQHVKLFCYCYLDRVTIWRSVREYVEKFVFTNLILQDL
jgi:ribonucleoside-diphosphate reductase alpha chain